MFLKQLRSQTKENAWSEFYENDDNYELYKNKFIENQIQPINSSFTGNNVYIYNSIFLNCYATDLEGGAIRFSKEEGRILIEFTLFSNCSAKKHSGAIYAENCNCVVNYACGIGCCQTITEGNNYGQFIRTDLKNENRLNYLLYSSACSTPETPYGNGAPVDLLGGELQCKYINVSNYIVREYSALCSGYNSKANISYCLFISNHARKSVCLSLYESNSTFFVDSCNIINNSQETDNSGTIYCYENTIIKHCCIKDNKSKYLFYVNKDVIVNIYKTYISYEYDSYTTELGTLQEESPINDSKEKEISFVDCEHLLKRFRISAKMKKTFHFL